METDLRATTERIKSLEAGFTEANWVWKRYKRELWRMETHPTNATKTTKSMEADRQRDGEDLKGMMAGMTVKMDTNQAKMNAKMDNLTEMRSTPVPLGLR
jgi:hypothetical protein